MSLDIRAARAASAPAGVHRQNAAGDIVIPLERGEIVALPRLWDFDLSSADLEGCVLVGAGGLVATVELDDGTAVVESVTDGAPARSAGRR